MTVTASPDRPSPSERQTRRARQLLAASASHSYDPRIDIDWAAPLEPGKWFVPEHRCTLYGTPLWASLTLEQRLAVSREELASSIALGVWTEHMLLQLVARYVYDRPVASPEVQFALTEVADEVRHMIMFARVVEAIGSEGYPTPWKVRESGRLLKTAAPVTALWALVLLTEEVFDRTQRELAADESVQPVVRAMARLHVVEEARHIGFARTELERVVPTLSKTQLSALRTMLALAVRSFADELVNPVAFTRAGLEPRAAVPPPAATRTSGRRAGGPQSTSARTTPPSASSAAAAAGSGSRRGSHEPRRTGRGRVRRPAVLIHRGLTGTAVTSSREVAVDVLLAGGFQPLDGRYHWYGRVRAAAGHTLPPSGESAELRTPHGTAAGRLSDLDLWGRLRITGRSTPPFPVPATLDELRRGLPSHHR
jgi:hypothetical protein